MHTVPAVSACLQLKRKDSIISLLQPRCDAHTLGIDETVGSTMVFSSFLPLFLSLPPSLSPPPPSASYFYAVFPCLT